MGWLDGPRAKLCRAYEHHAALNDEITTFFEGPGYSLTPDFNTETDECVIRVKVSEEPNVTRWGLLLGDFCTNAMAALDHLAYALTEFSTKQSPPPRESEIYFPIVRESKDWKGRQNSDIPDICPRLQAIIEAAQPYHAPPKERSAHPLIMLREMVRRDKHRRLPVMVMASGGVGGTLNIVRDCEPGPGPLAPPFRGVLSIIPRVVEDGTEIATFSVKVTGPNPEVEVNLNVPSDVWLEPGGSYPGLFILPDRPEPILDFIEDEVIAPVEREIGA